MTTTKQLKIALGITTLFGLLSVSLIVELSKSAQFHYLNILQIKGVAELQEKLTHYQEQPVEREKITNVINEIKKLPQQCLDNITIFDRVIMFISRTEYVIKLCEDDLRITNNLVSLFNEFNEKTKTDTLFIEEFKHQLHELKKNSDKFITPVNKINNLSRKIALWSIIPFLLIVILFSVHVFNKINNKTDNLQKAIVNLKRSKEENKQLAYYDTLTELPNRNLFTEILEHEIHQVKRYHQSFALFYIDLDRFKLINDTLGHEAGDNLLKQVAERLTLCKRESDTLARFGGDEFLLILSGEHSEKHAPIVAQKMINTLTEAFLLNDHKMYISASIGISYCPRDGLDNKTLIKRADIAMYEAKANGKNQYHAYEAEQINHKTEHRLTLEKELRHALEKEELKLYYQPVIDLINMEVAGAEALIRWEHLPKGTISPVEFIPIAENIGMIIEIGNWVIEQACKQCKQWRDSGYEDFHVAINVSALQLKNDNLPYFIEAQLIKYSLPADAIDIEITESAFYGEDQRAINSLNKLSDKGLRLLLDDFGTGFSSLSTLHDLPFNILKIDRSFMNINNEDKRTMLKTISNMAHNFKMKIVAEGVEDIETISFLRDLNCHYAQGYYFQKPVSAEEFDIEKNYNFDIKSVKKIINA